jgi:hypothetical protein
MILEIGDVRGDFAKTKGNLTNYPGILYLYESLSLTNN